MNRPNSLFRKELDGECTASESVELDRSEWTNPDLRRSRDAWRRTKAAMSALGPVNPPVPVDRWANAIMQSAPPSPAKDSWSTGSSRGWLGRIWSSSRIAWSGTWPGSSSPSSSVWSVLPWGAWSLAATAGLVVVLWPDAMGTTALPSTVGLQPASQSAPVEIRIDALAVEEQDQVPVSIRF